MTLLIIILVLVLLFGGGGYAGYRGGYGYWPGGIFGLILIILIIWLLLGDRHF